MATRPLIIPPGSALHPNPKKQGVILTSDAIAVMDEFSRESVAAHNDHTARMVNLAFRFGYRCALVDCVPAPGLVTAQRISERAKFYLDDKYIEI